jgi:hypothetical protein
MILDFTDALGAKILQRRLAGRRLAPSIQVEACCGQQRD